MKAPEGYRRCHKCGAVQPLAAFSNGHYRCKPCRQDDWNARMEAQRREAIRAEIAKRNREFNSLVRWPRYE